MTTDPNQTPEHTGWSDAALDAEPVLSRRFVHRIGWVVVAVLLLVLLTVLPPLINVSHYQRRVAQAISASIARPVHFDEIHLHLLPLPGLTIQNFVVEEDPAFGSEPVLRANVVEARLRFSSLWRRRVEVSHINLLAPSINLVRRADGRWNLQGVITQAGYLQNAPTVQGRAGPAPRFPYIEATDARINVKSGATKLPWSLLDAKLALWLPDQNEWRVRLRGRPLRTDTDVSDVGMLDLEGSLGRGATSIPGGVTEQPLAISARWFPTPLGESAKLFLGRDTGLRGAASAELEVRGTPAHMRLSTDMHLHNLRRSEFVPRLPMSLDAHCEADAQGVLHALHNLRCAVPTAQSGGLLDGVFRSHEEAAPSAPDVLVLQADIPDLLRPATATAHFEVKDAQPEYFLNWLRVFSSRVPESVTASGHVTFYGDWNNPIQPGDWDATLECHCYPHPDFTSPSEVAAPRPDKAAEPQPEALYWALNISRNGTSMPDETRGQLVGTRAVILSLVKEPPPGSAAAQYGSMDPDTTVYGRIDTAGIQMQYASYNLARYVSELIPPLGENLVDNGATLSATRNAIEADRAWGGSQRWMVMGVETPQPSHRRHSH